MNGPDCLFGTTNRFYICETSDNAVPLIVVVLERMGILMVDREENKRKVRLKVVGKDAASQKYSGYIEVEPSRIKSCTGSLVVLRRDFVSLSD